MLQTHSCLTLRPENSLARSSWILVPHALAPIGRTAVPSPPTHSITLLRQASSSSGVSCRTHVFMLLSSACAGQVSTGFRDTSHTIRYCVGAELQKKIGGHDVKAGHTIGIQGGVPWPHRGVCVAVSVRSHA